MSYENGSMAMAKTGLDPKAEADDFKKQVEAYIQKYRPLFEAIVMDKSLKFKAGDGFKIDFASRVVTLDTNDFKLKKERGLSEEQILFSVCHELSHFLDFKTDPDGMLENFKYLKSKARELAPKVLDVWRRRMGDPLPAYLTQQMPVGENETMDYTEIFVYKQMHRHIYNALDDIYVNRRIGRRVAKFSDNGSGYPEVMRLYRDLLFPTDPQKEGEEPLPEQAADFQSLPKSAQLCDALLRRSMVPDQAVLVSPEVRDLLMGYADEIAEKYGETFQNEVFEKIVSPSNPKTSSAKWRYQRIRAIVEPVFFKFFWQDLETMPLPPKPKDDKGKNGDKSQGSQGENKEQDGESGGDFDPWQMSKPDDHHMDDSHAKAIIKNAADEKDAKEKAKADEKISDKARKKAAQEKKDEKICASQGISPEVVAGYRKIEESLKEETVKKDGDKEVKDRSSVEQLAAVFEQVMQTIESTAREEWYKHMKSGRFNEESFINKYGPEIVANRYDDIPLENLPIHDKKDQTYRFTFYPSKIKFRLVLDGSGSMAEKGNQEDGEHQTKIEIVRRLYVQFMEALSRFEIMVNQRFRLTESFSVDTQVIMFGETYEVVKPFSQGKQNPRDEMGKRFAAFSKINADLGGTNDAAPIAYIGYSLTSVDEERLKNGKNMDLIILVTDGATQTPDATKDLVGQVLSKGADIRALQIGEPSQNDVEIFESVWKDPALNQRYGSLGERVPRPSDLPKAVAKILAKKLASMQIKISADSDD